MAAKRIRIRLYRVQDYDLVALYYDEKFGLRSKIEQALISFANGRPLPSFSLKGVAPLPKPEELENGKKTKTGTKFVIVTHVSIPERETAAIELVDSLTSGDLMNSFLKTLVRRCFVDVEYLYLEGDAREKYKDPGNAVSSKNIVVQEVKEEPASVPTKRPYKKGERLVQNVPADAGNAVDAIRTSNAPVRNQPAEKLVDVNNPADEYASTVPSDKASLSEQTKQESSKPKTGASLFDFADSYSY